MIKTNGYSKILEELSDYMKKIKIICLLIISILFTSGCSFNKNNLDNATIYTTTYPVSFITNYLYGDNSTILSIYPSEVDLDSYKLTDKQIKEYAKGVLFVYLGLGHEERLAKSFLNENNALLIIDATYGLSDNINSVEELWVAPNNFLMLAKNIKNSLIEYLDNSLKAEEINKKYDDLYVKVSWIDAELRSIAKEAKENDNNTLVVSSNVFKFLEHYGFNVISLEEIVASDSENALNEIKNKFKNAKYSSIIKLANESDTELITELVEKYKATVIEIKDITTNADSSSDYISIQYENIALIRNLLIK